MSVVEIIVVLRLRVIVLDGMTKDGFIVWFTIFILELSVEAFLLNIVDGHENLSKFWHPAELFRFNFLGLGAEVNVLDLNLFETLIVLGDVIVQLQDLLPFIFLVLINALLKCLRLIFKLLVADLQILVGLDQQFVSVQNTTDVIELVRKCLLDLLQVPLILHNSLSFQVNSLGLFLVLFQ